MSALDVEDVQDRALGHSAARALRHGRGEQALEVVEIVQFRPDVGQVTGCDLADFTAGRAARAAQVKQSADVLELEAEFTCAANKD